MTKDFAVQLDDVLGLMDMASEVLADASTGKNGRHALAGLLRGEASLDASPATKT